jgi:hypothetical protein
LSKIEDFHTTNKNLTPIKHETKCKVEIAKSLDLPKYRKFLMKTPKIHKNSQKNGRANSQQSVCELDY